MFYKKAIVIALVVNKMKWKGYWERIVLKNYYLKNYHLWLIH